MAKKNLTDLIGKESAKSAALPKLYAAGSESSLPLEQIADRPGSDTRPLNSKHVEALAESIAVLGLIEPLAVDKEGRLLAGGHRKAAIALLQSTKPDAFADRFPGGKIPVRMMPFDAEQQPDLALQIEIAENEQRRDYTTAEVKAIAGRLREAGYVDLKGRPKQGERPLLPALTVIIGKSRRQLNYILAETTSKPTEKSLQDCNLLLKRSLKALQKWQSEQAESDADIAKAIRLIEKKLKAMN